MSQTPEVPILEHLSVVEHGQLADVMVRTKVGPVALVHRVKIMNF